MDLKGGSLGIPVVDAARAQYIVVLIGLLLQHMGRTTGDLGEPQCVSVLILVLNLGLTQNAL
jgi:hypothetical protein